MAARLIGDEAGPFFVGRRMQRLVELPLRALLEDLSEGLAEIPEGKRG